MIIAVFVAVFMGIVLVHEFGHYIFAKVFDVRVLEFAVGFGPAIWKKKGKDTVFRINVFPFGGYVRLSGENPEEMSEEDAGRRFYDKPAWQRLLIALGGPLFSVLAGYILFAVVVNVWGVNLSGIGAVLPDTPAERAGLQAGDRILKINGKYVFDPMVISSMIKQGRELSLTVLRDGKEVVLSVKPEKIPQQVDLRLASAEGSPSGDFLDLEGFEQITSELLQRFENSRIRLKFEKGYVEGILQEWSLTPARYALGFVFAGYSNVFKGDHPPFEAGDKLVRVNGIPLENWLWMVRVFNFVSLGERDACLELYGKKVDWFTYGAPEFVEVTVERKEKILNFKVKREVLRRVLEDPTSFELQLRPYKPGSFVRRIDLAVSRCNWILMLTWKAFLGRGFFKSIARGEVTGPVGLAQIVGTAAKVGLDSVIVLVAIITINLGIFNLLPLPALDGGRIIFAVVEIITRKKINPKLEAMIHTIGFFLLLLLLIYITFMDVGRMMGR